MPKRPRHGAPDKDGWQLVGAGGGKPPAHDGEASVGRSVPTALPVATDDRPNPARRVDTLAGRSTPPLASPMVVDDCPERSAPPPALPMGAEDRAKWSDSPPALPMVTDDRSEPAAGTSSTAEGDGTPAIPAATPPRQRVTRQRHTPKREFTPRACVDCDWTVVFNCRSALDRHLRQCHGTFFCQARLQRGSEGSAATCVNALRAQLQLALHPFGVHWQQRRKA